jgi:hypothetical protein
MIVKYNVNEVVTFDATEYNYECNLTTKQENTNCLLLLSSFDTYQEAENEIVRLIEKYKSEVDRLVQSLKDRYGKNEVPVQWIKEEHQRNNKQYSITKTYQSY